MTLFELMNFSIVDCGVVAISYNDWPILCIPQIRGNAARAGFSQATAVFPATLTDKTLSVNLSKGSVADSTGGKGSV